MILRPKKSAGRGETFKTECEVWIWREIQVQKDQRNQQNIKEKKKVIMARTVDDCERINVIESTTVDSTSHDNPTLKIQIPKLEGVSFNFEFENEVRHMSYSRILFIENQCALSIWN